MTLKRWLPIALLLVAFAMRTAWLAEVPPGLHHDEVIYASIAEKALGGGWSIFYAEGQGREGFYIPFLAAALKWLGTGTFALRVPSVFLSVLGLCAVYALTRRLFGSFAALFALAEMSFTFWSLFPGRVALRAVTEPLVAALAAYALWKAISNSKSQISSVKVGQFMVAGCLIGLTVYTYRGARVLPGIVLLLPLYLVLFDRPMLRRAWRGLLMCAVVVVLVAAPLVILLITHPGLDQLDWAGRDQVLKTLSAGDVRPLLGTSVATLGAFFARGDLDDYYNLGGRPVFGLVTGALFAVGVLIALRRIRQLPYAYLLMWFVLALAPGMVSQPAPHFYHIIGAQMAAFAFPGIALKNLKSQVSNLKGRAIHLRFETWYLIFVLALVAADGLWNTRDYFIAWGRKETVRVLWNKPMAEVAGYLDRSEEQTPVAVCTLLINRHEPWLQPAPSFFRYLMRRDASLLRFNDCRYSLIFPNGGVARYAFPGTAPIDRFASRFLMPWLDGAAPIEGMPLSPDNALLRVDVRQSLDAKLARLAFAPVDFGHVVELIGYELPVPDPRPGQPVVLMTWWRVKQSLSPNLTMFAHLLQDEHIVAQQDLFSVMPDTLQPGDVFAQVHEFINVPPEAKPGDYALAIGLYDSVTGQRLTIYDGGAARGDRLTLTTVRIP
jgi:4-amino-4-deoxy-L-arabinose transferase-like glycosyltransferase